MYIVRVVFLLREGVIGEFGTSLLAGADIVLKLFEK